MRSHFLKLSSLALVPLLLGACVATQPRYSDSRYSEARHQPSQYQDSRYQDARYRDDRYPPPQRSSHRLTNRCGTCGTVEEIDTVWARDRVSGGGAVLGAIIGGVVGNQVGSGSGRQAATVAGAVAGGVIGHQAEQRRSGEQPLHLFRVRLDDGRWAEVTQRDNPGLRIGDRVIIRNQQLTLLR